MLSFSAIFIIVHTALCVDIGDFLIKPTLTTADVRYTSQLLFKVILPKGVVGSF